MVILSSSVSQFLSVVAGFVNDDIFVHLAGHSMFYSPCGSLKRLTVCFQVIRYRGARW